MKFNQNQKIIFINPGEIDKGNEEEIYRIIAKGISKRKAKNKVLKWLKKIQRYCWLNSPGKSPNIFFVILPMKFHKYSQKEFSEE